MNDFLALAAIMFWALVPLFWIPVHGFPGLFRKLGIVTYLTPAVTWLPFAWLVYANRGAVLSRTIDLPLLVRGAGWIVLLLGLLLQLWTLRILGGLRIIGLPEVTRLVENRIITTGPFSVIRHPTYASHTLMFAGAFLVTGVIAVGIITLLDLVIINAVVIPLEDRELVMRFGDAYREYRERLPAFFPRIFSR